MSTWRLKVDLSMLYQASINSRASFVVACPSTLVCDQSKVCPYSYAWFAGRELGSCLLIASRCSVSRVSTFLDVFPIYRCGQLRQGKMQTAFHLSVVEILSLCFVKMVASLWVGLWATVMLCCLSNLVVISEVEWMYSSVVILFSWVGWSG